MGKKSKSNIKEGDSQMDLDNDFQNYIKEISRNIEKSDKQDDESKQLLINNFIEAAEGKEQAVALHGIGSKILDSLIGYSSPENFENYTSCMIDSLRKLIQNTKASFVLESILKIATLRALSGNDIEINEPIKKKSKFSKFSSDIDYNLELEIKPNHAKYCSEFIIKLSKFVLNNIEELFKGQGNHFVRTCLLCLSGIVNVKSHDKSTPNQINIKVIYNKSIEPEWIEIACDFSTRLLQWPHFSSLAFEEKSSTLLQTLCQSLSNLEQQVALKELTKAILKKCFKEEGEISEIKEIEKLKPFSSKPATFLLESVMNVCSEKQFNKIYTKYFKSNLLEMCDSMFNFSVQRLVDSIKCKEIFEEVFNTITPQFSSLLQNGKTGVVLSICKGCDRLCFKQGQFIQSLVKALECEKSQNHTIHCIVSLLPLKIAETKNEIEVNLHGSLILQHILKFNKPIKIVNSLLEMKPHELSDIFCHPKGSRIADSYLDSKFIGEKSREKLVIHLKAMYPKMATSKNGSHVLEKLYQISSDSQKEIIVKELSERMNQLNGSSCGKIINYKFNVQSYARNPNQWRSNFFAQTSKV